MMLFDRQCRAQSLGLCLVAFLGMHAAAAESPDGLLAKVADLKLHRRERNFAARRLLASPDTALVALRNGLSSKRAIIRQMSALLLGELGLIGAEADLLSIGLKSDPLTAMQTEAALPKLYRSLDEKELARRITGQGIDKEPSKGVAAVAGLRAAVLVFGQADAPALPKDIEDAAVRHLGSRDTDLRQAACKVLGMSASDAVAKALLAHIKTEKHPKVLVAACQSLAMIRPAEGGEPVLMLSSHSEREVQLEALVALRHMGYGDIVARMATFLKHPSVRMRLRTVEVLRDLPEARKLLVHACSDISWRVRRSAAEALGATRQAGSSGILRRLFRDSDARVRAEAAIQLHRMRVIGVVNPLLDELSRGTSAARVEAARALGIIRSERAVIPLVKALSADDLELACRAAEALGAIGSQTAKRGLFNTLSSKRPALSDTARQTLAALCKSDPGDDPAQWEKWAAEQKIR